MEEEVSNELIRLKQIIMVAVKQIRKIGKSFLILIKPLLVLIFELEANLSKRWVRAAHKRLLWGTWSIPDHPEFFDHQIDLFYYWQESRTSHWLERGVFGSLALKRNGSLLELACGDGFNSRNFYSGLVKSVIACDFEKNAIVLQKEKTKLQM